MEKFNIKEWQDKHVIKEADTVDPVKTHVQGIVQAIIDLEEKLEFDYGSNATTELHKISGKFIDGINKIAKKYK